MWCPTIPYRRCERYTQWALYKREINSFWAQIISKIRITFYPQCDLLIYYIVPHAEAPGLVNTPES
jgi:hypothetical protein